MSSLQLLLLSHHATLSQNMETKSRVLRLVIKHPVGIVLIVSIQGSVISSYASTEIFSNPEGGVSLETPVPLTCNPTLTLENDDRPYLTAEFGNGLQTRYLKIRGNASNMTEDNIYALLKVTHRYIQSDLYTNMT
jgi:hypothetical protein